MDTARHDEIARKLEATGHQVLDLEEAVADVEKRCPSMGTEERLSLQDALRSVFAAAILQAFVSSLVPFKKGTRQVFTALALLIQSFTWRPGSEGCSAVS